MKKMLFALTGVFVLSILLVSCSSDEFEIKETEVPKDVLNAFKTKYPSAQVIKWEAEKEDGKFYFEAEWKENDKKKEVHISPDGSTLSEED